MRPPEAPAAASRHDAAPSASRFGRARERLTPKRLHAPSLDWLNFLVADVRGALGPYVVVFLVADQKWNEASVGWVMALGGWIGIIAQMPIGGWIDHSRRKRAFLLAALAIVSAGALIITFLPFFWPVLLANIAMQIVSGVFEPVIAALTVGLFARSALTRRMGRNAAWSRAGNLVVAITSGALAWMIGARAVFLQVPAIAALTVVAVMTIPYAAVDQRKARGLRSGEKATDGPTAWLRLFRSRPMLVFGACSFLHELAEAPLLVLVAQKLAVEYEGWGFVITSGCIVTSQLGAMLAAMAIGPYADRIGYRWLLALGFASLPLRAVLTVLWSDPYWLIGLQALGGIGTGLLAALTPLWLSDATRGSGRYNLSQGAMGTLRALGVTTSALVSEFIVHHAGYAAAFIACGAIGAAATVLLWFALPDVSSDEGEQKHPAPANAPA